MPATTASPTTSTSITTMSRTPSARRPAPGPPFGVALLTLRLVDSSRTIRLPAGRVEPRPLITILRYPVRAHCPCPLIVFGHGFAVTPAPYAALLRAWTRAGYVVAAPIFPLGNADAPGGPNESDLVNQPGDMSFIITRLSSVFPRLIDRHRVAVAGQS